MTEHLSLLTAKLAVPPLRNQIMERPRLIERLEEGLRLGRRLTLVSAPAGYGKTTLLAEWLRPKVDSRWISLDEGDNDPARFLAYLTAALGSAGAPIGQTGLGVGRQPATEEHLTALLNQISATPHDVILVLDDYHLITAQAVHQILTFVLDHLPANLHLVIATRADPPLPLARLRGRGQLTELRLGHLRFTTGEAATFLKAVAGLTLSPEDAAALTARTEGWAAGLQMAAASMQEREDVAGFIRAFASSNRYILDYLIEEVLQRQPEHIQAFLLQTSILDRMCGSLCDAVVETQGHPPAGQQVLEELERANLFIIPLDDRREWYRYHRLFADLLRQRLRQFHPERIADLHRRASVWHEQHGSSEDAIEHALLADDAGRAAELIERAAEATLMRSEIATVLRWMDALPETEIRSRPGLAIYRAWARLWSGAPLSRIEESLQAAGLDDSLAGKVIPLHAFLALYQGRLAEAENLSQQAAEHPPKDEPLLNGLASLVRASTRLINGDASGGLRILEEAAQDHQHGSNVIIAAVVLCRLADLQNRQGQLRQSEALYQQALELATDEQGRRMPIASQPLVGLSRLAREWNDLETAERLAMESIELAGRWGALGALNSYLTLATIREARGDLAGALETIRLARQPAQQTDATRFDDMIVDEWEARLQIRCGDLSFAAAWAEQRGLTGAPAAAGITPDQDRITARLRKYETMVLARLRLAQGRHNDALDLLRQVEALARSADRPGLAIEAAIVEALAYQALGRQDSALSALEGAIQLAEPEGYMRIFLDEGERLVALLQALRPRVRANHLASHIDKLIAAFSPSSSAGQPAARKAPQAQQETMVEPLSARELEVLRLLASSLSTGDMAAKLAISANTLRSHLKNIYGKLDAHSRYEATARARAMQLL